MTTDIETIRRHERSLRGLLRSQPNHTRDPFVEALQWSLARVREAIAKAEAYGSGLTKEDWRPIETAPRDGTQVLALSGDRIEVLAHDTWTDLGRSYAHWITSDGHVRNDVTHWMPLPEVPR
jgi:hypothetical protein